MKMVLVLLLLSLGNFTQALAKTTAPSALQEITKPTGVKVRAAFNAWESYLNPNMCYPDSFAFKVTPPADGKWEAVILQAVRAASTSVEFFTDFSPLATETEVRKAGTDLLQNMGMVDDPKFGDKLKRVFEKVDARMLFAGSTANSKGLIGRFIAIVDLETNELVLLTDGDAFEASRCEE